MAFGRLIDRTLLWSSAIGFGILIFDLGFRQNQAIQANLSFFYVGYSVIAFLALSGRIFMKKTERPFRRLAHYITWGMALLFLLAEIAISTKGGTGASNIVFAQWLAGILFFTEFSERLFALQQQLLHPALIFVISFVLLILAGALLLLLPESTNHGISWVDALFTSTSAVCVTGLAVVDTGKEFTRFGQIILLLLIQAGGLGILTFTNLFGFIFRGKTSFQNQLMLKDFINAENIGNTFRTLIKIVLFTLGVEAIGAILVFMQIEEHQIAGTGERVFFAIFHSVSAFCNAGFSTLTNGLYELPIRFEYGVHLVIAFLIIIGGIGYIIVFNYSTYFKNWIIARYNRLMKKKNAGYRRPIISLNTKIVVYTTIILLVFGTVAYFILEYDNTLKEHTTLWGKFVTSFFGSVTPRTAGFNTVNIGAMTPAMLLIYLLLMWIGASPGSTGGGIKTSTFAVGSLNIWQQITGRSRMELWWKEIPPVAARRAFGIISLSLIAVGFSVFFVTIFDPKLDLLPVAFECFSAYGTVGLSMGITPTLTDTSKIILTITMFVGRVSFLTLLIGIIQQIFRQKQKPYRFPEEEIFIT